MITLSTIVYEGNFRKLLNKDSWFLNYNNKYISKKRLNVNNIYSVDEFNSLLTEISNDIEVKYVNDKSVEANEYFKLNTNPDTHGYNYIIPYFTDLLTIETEYVFNVASDSQNNIFIDDDFFEKSFKILTEDDDVLTTTITWGLGDNNTHGTGEQQHADSIDTQNNHIVKRNDEFWFSKVFCDQLFIAKVDKLKKSDFTITLNLHPYPTYGGFSFELRLGNNLMINNKYRAIYKSQYYYVHGKD